MEGEASFEALWGAFVSALEVLDPIDVGSFDRLKNARKITARTAEASPACWEAAKALALALNSRGADLTAELAQAWESTLARERGGLASAVFASRALILLVHDAETRAAAEAVALALSYLMARSYYLPVAPQLIQPLADLSLGWGPKLLRMQTFAASEAGQSEEALGALLQLCQTLLSIAQLFMCPGPAWVLPAEEVAAGLSAWLELLPATAYAPWAPLGQSPAQGQLRGMLALLVQNAVPRGTGEDHVPKGSTRLLRCIAKRLPLLHFTARVCLERISQIVPEASAELSMDAVAQCTGWLRLLVDKSWRRDLMACLVSVGEPLRRVWWRGHESAATMVERLVSGLAAHPELRGSWLGPTHELAVHFRSCCDLLADGVAACANTGGVEPHNRFALQQAAAAGAAKLAGALYQARASSSGAAAQGRGDSSGGSNSSGAGGRGSSGEAPAYRALLLEVARALYAQLRVLSWCKTLPLVPPAVPEDDDARLLNDPPGWRPAQAVRSLAALLSALLALGAPGEGAQWCGRLLGQAGVPWKGLRSEAACAGATPAEILLLWALNTGSLAFNQLLNSGVSDWSQPGETVVGLEPLLRIEAILTRRLAACPSSSQRLETLLDLLSLLTATVGLSHAILRCRRLIHGAKVYCRPKTTHPAVYLALSSAATLVNLVEQLAPASSLGARQWQAMDGTYLLLKLTVWLDGLGASAAALYMGAGRLVADAFNPMVDEGRPELREPGWARVLSAMMGHLLGLEISQEPRIAVVTMPLLRQLAAWLALRLNDEVHDGAAEEDAHLKELVKQLGQGIKAICTAVDAQCGTAFSALEQKVEAGKASLLRDMLSSDFCCRSSSSLGEEIAREMANFVKQWTPREALLGATGVAWQLREKSFLPAMERAVRRAACWRLAPCQPSQAAGQEPGGAPAGCVVVPALGPSSSSSGGGSGSSSIGGGGSGGSSKGKQAGGESKAAPPVPALSISAAAGQRAAAALAAAAAAPQQPARPAAGRRPAEGRLGLGPPVVAVEREVIVSQTMCVHPGCTSLHEPPRLLRCAGCKVARYCGAACGKSDWERHRPLCRALRQLKAANCAAGGEQDEGAEGPARVTPEAQERGG